MSKSNNYRQEFKKQQRQKQLDEGYFDGRFEERRELPVKKKKSNKEDKYKSWKKDY